MMLLPWQEEEGQSYFSLPNFVPPIPGQFSAESQAELS